MIAVAGMVTLVADPALVGDAGRPQLTSLSLLAETADSASWLARGGDPSLSVAFAGMAELQEPVTLPRAPRRLPGSWLTVAGPGESWARSWAVAGETSARGTEGLLLPEPDEWVVAGAGPVAEVSPARIDVVRRSFDGRFHTVALEIRSGLSGLVTGVRLPDGLPASFRSVQGQPLGPAESVRALRWWGHTRGDPLRLEVRVSAGHDVIELDVIEQHLSPQEIVGPDFFVRDARLVPDVRTGSDRMILRTRVSIPLAREVSPLQADRGRPAHLP